jgi:4-hydroxybenzoate polyprenyltransferase
MAAVALGDSGGLNPMLSTVIAAANFKFTFTQKTINAMPVTKKHRATAMQSDIDVHIGIDKKNRTQITDALQSH